MSSADRIGTFFVDRYGYLVRHGRPRSGREYEHRCELKALQEVAHTIDELDGAVFSYEQVHAIMNGKPDANWPFTQVAVAVAFLKERGIIVPAGGRKHIANDACYLDALIEYHALREEPEHRIG